MNYKTRHSKLLSLVFACVAPFCLANAEEDSQKENSSSSKPDFGKPYHSSHQKDLWILAPRKTTGSVDSEKPSTKDSTSGLNSTDSDANPSSNSKKNSPFSSSPRSKGLLAQQPLSPPLFQSSPISATQNSKVTPTKTSPPSALEPKPQPTPAQTSEPSPSIDPKIDTSETAPTIKTPPKAVDPAEKWEKYFEEKQRRRGF